MKDSLEFERVTGLDFQDKGLLRQAFVHRSYINEHRDAKQGHNERLEFLGDAVLELIATDFLFKKFPDRNEGDLTAFRSALVNTNTLSTAAQNLSMNDYLLLSRGESKDVGRARSFILANTFEALIGAIYLDRGYEDARRFVAKHLLYRIDEIVEKRLWQDAKSYFQEKAQDVLGTTPEYETLGETGPDHDKCFTVGVFIGSEKIAEGQGQSKQEAETEAARKALEVKGW